MTRADRYPSPMGSFRYPDIRDITDELRLSFQYKTPIGDVIPSREDVLQILRDRIRFNITQSDLSLNL